MDDSNENFGLNNIRDSFDSIALSDVLTDLQAGAPYIQVHTYDFRNVEIRGQVLPIPEPGTASILSPGENEPSPHRGKSLRTSEFPAVSLPE